MSNVNESRTNKAPMSQFIEPRAFLSRDGEYVTLVLPGNLLIRKHVHFFKKVMGIPFTPKKVNVSTPQAL